MQAPLEIKTAIQIGKPAHEIFEAIVDPDKMKNYFISKSTGRMEEGKHILWNFPEFAADIPIRIGKIEQDGSVSFYWQGAAGKETLVEITLEPQSDCATLVRITEKGMMNNLQGISWLGSNTEGWANCLACMKAWLEYGINLRKGAFDFMRKK